MMVLPMYRFTVDPRTFTPVKKTVYEKELSSTLRLSCSNESVNVAPLLKAYVLVDEVVHWSMI